MGKKGVIVLLLLLTVFLYGCTANPATTGSVSGAYAACNGDDVQMITAQFAEFAPVSSETNPYQPGEAIDVEVQLTNKLSEAIPQGSVKVRLTGEAAIDSIFTGAREVTADTLYEIDPESCLEEVEDVELAVLTYQGDITTKISKEIAGLYCYQHPVEVKAFLYFTKDAEEIGVNLPSGSNPPSSVQVVKIEQEPVDIDDMNRNTADMRFKIHLENVGEGIIVDNLNECFKFRDASYREEFRLEVSDVYNMECPSSVKLSRGEQTDVITCKVSNIDATNLGPNPVEITITLSDFAYEDVIPATTVWLEP